MDKIEMFNTLRELFKTKMSRKDFCRKYKINYNTFGNSICYTKELSVPEALAIAKFMEIPPCIPLKFTDYLSSYKWHFASGGFRHKKLFKRGKMR